MTKTALTLAAALLAGTTLSNAASAGGIRLGFGMPLGSFVAHSFQNQSSGSSYGQQHCAKPAPRHYVAEAAPVRHVTHVAPRHVEVAEEAPVRHVRKIEKAPVEIKTAKLEDNTVSTDAAPSIVVPDSPPVAEVTGTQSTPAITTAALSTDSTATTQTAALVKDEPKVETATVEKDDKVEKDEPKRKFNLTVDAKRICRRFSAAIAGLIDVPCE